MYTPKSKIFDLKTPKTIIPTPTNDDYELGFIDRYFVRKANDINGFIFEVDKDSFEDYLENPYWIGAELKWRIAGPVDPVYDDMGEIVDKGVILSNKASLSYTSKFIKNIGLYLPNILQFHK